MYFGIEQAGRRSEARTMYASNGPTASSILFSFLKVCALVVFAPWPPPTSWPLRHAVDSR